MARSRREAAARYSQMAPAAAAAARSAAPLTQMTSMMRPLLSVYLHTERRKKSTREQRQGLRVVVALDGLLLQTHAAEREPDGLLGELLAPHAVVHDRL